MPRASVYPVATHCTWSVEAPKSFWRRGIATLTMLVSSTAMKLPTITTISGSSQLRCCMLVSAVGAAAREAAGAGAGAGAGEGCRGARGARGARAAPLARGVPPGLRVAAGRASPGSGRAAGTALTRLTPATPSAPPRSFLFPRYLYRAAILGVRYTSRGSPTSRVPAPHRDRDGGAGALAGAAPPPRPDPPRPRPRRLPAAAHPRRDRPALHPQPRRAGRAGRLHGHPAGGHAAPGRPRRAAGRSRRPALLPGDPQRPGAPPDGRGAAPADRAVRGAADRLDRAGARRPGPDPGKAEPRDQHHRAPRRRRGHVDAHRAGEYDW